MTGVDLVDPTVDRRWGDLADAHGDIFHSPSWMRALRETYGFEPRARVTESSAIAYCEIDDAMGPRIVSLPFSDCCDPFVTSAADWTDVVAPLLDLGVPVHLRCRHDDRAAATENLEVVKRSRWHRVDVTPPADEIWSALDSSARRAVRRAQSNGVTVRPLEGEAGVRAFHALHVGLRKSKYRLLAQPLAFFLALMNEFEEDNRWMPLGAYVDDVLVAATVYIRYGDTLFYKFNTSSTAGLELRPNNLLLWEGVLLAQQIGVRTLDLGPSDDDQPGLIRFKRHHGGVESELRFLRFQPPGWSDPRRAEVGATLTLMTEALTEPGVSDAVCAAAGDALYRYFA